MSFPKHSAYTDSGVDWLGVVPKHWEVLPLYGAASERTESNLGMVEDNLLSLSFGRIVQKDISSNDGLLPESFETYQIVRPGDIVFRLTDLQNDKRSLRSALVGEIGIITSAYLALSVPKADPGYISYLFRSYDSLKIFYAMGGGLRQSLKFSDMKRLPLLRPPLSEQHTIAAFLNHETAKIDALVEEQRRLIQLLKEKRQAVISRAVTKGLDPSVPMKDSGIEWLGKVPAHWEMTRLGWLASEINDINHEMPEGVAEGVPFLSAKDLDDFGNIDFNNDAKLISQEDFDRLSRKIRPKRGDIVYSRIGTIGRACIVRTDAMFLVSYSCCVIRITRSDIVLDYLRDLLASDLILTESRSRVRSMGQPDLGLGEIRRFPIPLPPVEEQGKIDSYLKSQISGIDLLLCEASIGIALLEERRSALISAAVTGKIDVRKWHKQEELEPA